MRSAVDALVPRPPERLRGMPGQVRLVQLHHRRIDARDLRGEHVGQRAHVPGEPTTVVWIGRTLMARSESGDYSAR